MEVKLVRLVTGEELIGRVAAESDETMTLDKILQFVVNGHQPDGRPNVMMVPWMPHLDGDRRQLFKKDIMLVDKIHKPLEDVYTRLTSGIVPANTLPDLSKVGKKLIQE